MDINLIMDNDSGYVSHYQESNFDSSENVHASYKTSPVNFYINEDALLEKPATNKQLNEYELDDTLYSVVNNSVQSVKTNFSGLEDSEESDSSLIIPKSRSVVYLQNEWHDISDDSLISSLDQSRENYSSFSDMLSRPFDSSHLSQKLNNRMGNDLVITRNSNHPPVKRPCVGENKENVNPVYTPKKQYDNPQFPEVSPDLFSDQEEHANKPRISIAPLATKRSPMKRMNNDSGFHKDVKLLKKVQITLSGVCPPPKMTTINFTLDEMLEKIDKNKPLFWTSSKEVGHSPKNNSSLLLHRSNHFVKNYPWPNITALRNHGLHFNRSKVSEEFEHLCSRYAERFVSSETQSTCTIFDNNDSPSRRRASRAKWTAKSPSRRLSHLARRRITFSNTNLQTSSSSILGSRTRQILVDAKKLSLLNKKKSPKKTSPKSPFNLKSATPNSSAKRKLAMRFRQMTDELENIAPSTSAGNPMLSIKRALFSSPTRERRCSVPYPGEKKSTKRALFPSPGKHSPQKKSPVKVSNMFERKRKRSESDEGNTLKIAKMTTSLDKSKSEEITEAHKKKLQWAIYEALRLQNISATHPQYKVFASNLARVTRKFLPNAHLDGRITEKIYRVARYHSYAVVKGKTVDEIVRDYISNKAKQKPQGYVGVDEFQKLNAKKGSVPKDVFQDKANILESIEKRKEHAGVISKYANDSRIDRIRKVISFDENGI